MMRALELKLPPVVVVLAIMLATGLAAQHGPRLEAPRAVRIIALVAFVAGGAAMALAGERNFTRAGTTVNPLHPEKASALVSTGIYRFTRNPMYLGMALVLVGWAAFLCSPWALLGPVALMAYLTRYQIIPEERILSEKFGAEYAAYRSRVRRWL